MAVLQSAASRLAQASRISVIEPDSGPGLCQPAGFGRKPPILPLSWLLHSQPAFGIALPVAGAFAVAISTGCGCSSVVEHDLAKVGVEGSSPFARSSLSKNDKALI
jgi:hypothetical protein